MALAMIDRLAALKEQISPDEYNPAESTLTVIQVDESEEQFNTVLLTADELTRVVSHIGKQVERLKENNDAIVTSFTNQTAKDENEQLMKEIKSASHKVHSDLKKMKQELEHDEGNPNHNTADFRIRKAQYATISRKFRDVMAEYNGAQEDYREKCKKHIQRQLIYAGKQVTEDQLEEMLDSKNPQIFTQDILLDTSQKRAALGEVEARHMEIMNLEANIRDLHEMFYDMALLVEEQGEMIDLIEHNVESAAVYVQSGQQSLKIAAALKPKIRRTKWIICCVVSSVCVILVIVLAIIIGIVVRFVS